MLVLSVFPGIDLLGRAFEELGVCVVRGPDRIFGGDIRAFTPPVGVFDGVVGGPPCQDFSRARRAAPTGYGLEMLDEFRRVIDQAQPQWWVLENVPSVPDVRIEGYSWQRFDLRASECGSHQSRLRHFQFGSLSGAVLYPVRSDVAIVKWPVALAVEGSQMGRRRWSDFCEVQGLPPDFDLPDFHVRGKYRAVGNGVPLQMGRVVARAVIALRSPEPGERHCRCGCGRPVMGKAIMATPACRKREQVRRDRERARVIVQGIVTDGASRM